MILSGYGKILDVNLRTRELIKREINEAFAKDFLGGMGFSAMILFEEVGPDVDPLSPENIIIFSNGPLTGTKAPCSGRTEITTKSPSTGNIGTGNTGGLWGTRLKHAGFDVIIVRGQAEKPVYLWINDDTVELRDAGHVWGQDAGPTSDVLCEELGPVLTKISVLTIGPAGENLVKYACPVNDYHHCAARCGAGAVMGAKRLKAIAVRGTGAVQIARPKEFEDACAEARERLMTSNRATSLTSGVMPDIRKVILEQGCLPGKNFQTGVLPRWLETRGAAVAGRYVTKNEGTCYRCPTSCFKLVEVTEGKYTGVKVSRGTAPGVAFEWGAKLAIDNLPAIWKCKELCQELGMDYASAGGSIAFAMELFQRGIITVEETDGLELGWGNEDSIIELLHKIAFRKGFGDVLAEGSALAAKRIGRDSEQYVMTTKGMEMMSDRDPRFGSRGWVFGELTNPRGGDNVKGTHFRADRYIPTWWTDQFDIFEDVKKKIYTMPPEEVSFAWEGKALMCKWFEDLTSACNGLGLCFFPASFNLAWGPTHLARLLSACTGWDTTPQDMMKMRERLFTVLKVYNVRQGLTRQDDIWPDRFFNDPLTERSAKGAVLSRELINSLLDEYYELRKWDIGTGLPTKETLIELGLDDIAADLWKLGKIPR